MRHLSRFFTPGPIQRRALSVCHGDAQLGGSSGFSGCWHADNLFCDRHVIIFRDRHVMQEAQGIQSKWRTRGPVLQRTGAMHACNRWRFSNSVPDRNRRATYDRDLLRQLGVPADHQRLVPGKSVSRFSTPISRRSWRSPTCLLLTVVVTSGSFHVLQPEETLTGNRNLRSGRPIAVTDFDAVRVGNILMTSKSCVSAAALERMRYRRTQ